MEIQPIILSFCIAILVVLVSLIILVARKGRRTRQLEDSLEYWKKVAKESMDEVRNYSSATAEAIEEASDERLKKQTALSNLEKMTEQAVEAERELKVMTLCRDAKVKEIKELTELSHQYRDELERLQKDRSVNAEQPEPPKTHPHDEKYPGTIHMECEEAVRKKLAIRRDLGRSKYGHTMERDDLSQEDWLLHAQEEAMDTCVYLERLLKNAGTERQEERRQ